MVESPSHMTDLVTTCPLDERVRKEGLQGVFDLGRSWAAPARVFVEEALCLCCQPLYSPHRASAQGQIQHIP